MCIYCIPNEIISSTLVYDQDANRSRGFILVALGAPLNFIAMLYSVFPICGNIDLYLDPFQELLKEDQLFIIIVPDCNFLLNLPPEMVF